MSQRIKSLDLYHDALFALHYDAAAADLESELQRRIPIAEIVVDRWHPERWPDLAFWIHISVPVPIRPEKNSIHPGLYHTCRIRAVLPVSFITWGAYFDELQEMTPLQPKEDFIEYLISNLAHQITLEMFNLWRIADA